MTLRDRTWLWTSAALGFLWFAVLPAVLPLPSVWWVVVGVYCTATVVAALARMPLSRAVGSMAGGLTVAVAFDIAIRGSTLGTLGDRSEWLKYEILEWIVLLIVVGAGGLTGSWIARPRIRGRHRRNDAKLG
jgi:hypothetical protein